MKRFAMTIGLAACLVFLLGASSMAANSVTVDSWSVLPNATGVFIGFYVENDVAITGFTMPIEVRSTSGGAYMAAGGFARGMFTGSRMDLSPLSATANNPGNPGGWPAASVTNRTFAVTDNTGSGCVRPSDPTLSWNTSAGLPDFVSPDAFMIATVSQGDNSIGEDISMDPGVDAAGNPSYRVTCNVGPNLGTFILDTTCIRPAVHVAFVNEATQTVIPTFTAGIITVEIPPNPCPINLSNGAVPAATVGSPVSVTINSTDAPENDARVYYPSVGTVTGNDGSDTWTYTPDCNDVANGVNVTIEVSDVAHPGAGNCLPPLTFHVNVAPANLAITCGNVTVHWAGADATQTITASGGCPPYTFSMNSGVGGLDPDPILYPGKWSYDQGCQDVGSSPVSVRVTDNIGGFVDCIFTLTVTNTAPTCEVIPPTLAPQGVDTPINLGPASQGDGDALVYTYVGGLPLAWAPSIAGNVFHATRPNGDGASYTVQYSVFDGCVTANCSFDYIFENPCVSILDDQGDGYGCALNGEQQTVCVVAEPGSIPAGAGGYDLLICYDQSGLTFLGAVGGPPGWEYFTYRTGQFGGNCSGGCPDGYVRLLSVAEMNNGVNIDPIHFNIDGDNLACLTFAVTSNRNFINSCLHVGFCSFDCGDNTFSNVSGNITWTPREGVSFGAYYECPDDPKVDYIPAISFCPGAICVCEPPDDRGDLNLNGFANEIGDAVLYMNFFIYGSGVWNPVWAQSQILASDVNDDGIVLTVADLIYLIRILTGDAQPFPAGTGTGSPKLAPYASSVDISSDVANGAVTVRTNAPVDLGAAMLVFRYSGLNVGAPTLANNSGLTIRSHAENGELRVLVSSTVETASARLGAGANNLLTIPVNGEGSIELVESQFSDYNGALLQVNAASAAIPTEYALKQNYPNPFNAGTVIPVQLTKESDYSLTIYNVAGQVVRTFSGNGIGTINVAWDGRTTDGASVASGMYFYRLTTPEFSATKKMVVLK